MDFVTSVFEALKKHRAIWPLGFKSLNTQYMCFFNDNNFINFKIFCCLPAAAAHRHRTDPSEQREGATSNLYPHQWPVEKKKRKKEPI